MCFRENENCCINKYRKPAFLAQLCCARVFPIRLAWPDRRLGVFPRACGYPCDRSSQPFPFWIREAIRRLVVFRLGSVGRLGWRVDLRYLGILISDTTNSMGKLSWMDTTSLVVAVISRKISRHLGYIGRTRSEKGRYFPSGLPGNTIRFFSHLH